MVQINLKLSLEKIKCIIKVSYNTFEKATYDQYLMASLALRSEDEQCAYQYIDDITGSGSLNAHFKQLYDKAHTLDENQLKNIMGNSMYPMLKIDKSNLYYFYPELNVSVFNNKLYEGDFGTYEDLIQRLYIQEEVIDHELLKGGSNAKPEPYLVRFDEGKILVKIAEEWVDLPEEIFQEVFKNDLTSIDKIESEIHNVADGSGWFALTNAVINNMYANNNYFYDNGDHCLIRNNDVKKIIIAQLAGFYVYKEEIIPYIDNKDLCEKVLNLLLENKSINEFKTKSIITLLTYSDDLLAQSVINYILARKGSKELALMGVELLVRGIEKNWEDEALKSFMTYADSSKYSYIYKANPELVTDVQMLSMINPDFLTPTHKKKVEEYKKNRQAIRDSIDKMVGEIATSGMRERSKQLKATDKTKRFHKLVKRYDAHSKVDYEQATLNELEKYLKEVTEMYDLMKELQEEISKEN